MLVDLPPVPVSAGVVAPTLRIASPSTKEVTAGKTRDLNGGLQGTDVVSGVKVEIQRDVWPFDNRWRHAASGVTNDRGAFLITVRTHRNTRYRAVAAGLTSPPIRMYANLVAELHRTTPSGPSFRATYTIRAPRDARFPARAHFYVFRLGRRTVPLAASPPLRRVRPGRFRATVTLPFVRPKRETVVIVCYRERTPDAWGRALPLDKRCGSNPLRVPDD